MNLSVNLKLKLTKIVKVITVKYNTFEKAAFDEYLVASIASRAKSSAEALGYIDEITGDGSLNAHFKTLYAEISAFDAATLGKIMTSSMYPREVINANNSYAYYPEPDVSVFKGKTYTGDLGGYKDLARDILYIAEDVTDLTVADRETIDKPQNYQVTISSGERLSVKVADKAVAIDAALFDRIVIKDAISLSAYRGKIGKNPSGDGWHLLSASAYNGLFSDPVYFYADGKHCRIRRDGLIVTEIAETLGLYVYRDTEHSYSEKPELCAKALDHVGTHKLFDKVKGPTLVNLLKNAGGAVAVEFLNAHLPRVIDGKIARFALELARSDGGYAWKRDTLQLLVEYCDKSEYSVLYGLCDGLHFTLDRLLYVDRNILREKDAVAVDKYYADLEAMKTEIRSIIADVVTSGLRERSKQLASDDEVKRFRKLCNELQGHESRDISDASPEQISKWHKSALELSALLPKIKRKLNSDR